MNIAVLSCIVLLSLGSCISIETFSATADLKLMLRTEQSLAAHIRNYISKEYARLRKLERVADEYERHSAEALKEADAHVSNPVNAFKLIKRLTRDWKDVRQECLTNGNFEDFNTLLASLEGTFPDQEDLQGATMALFRLVDTYSLDPLHFSLGLSPSSSAAVSQNARLSGKKDKSQIFSFYELYELGLLAFEMQKYYHNYLIFNATLTRLSEADISDTGLLTRRYDVTEVKLLGYMVFSLYKLGNLYKAYVLTLEILRIDPTLKTGIENKEMLEEALKTMGVVESRKEGRKEVQRPLDGFKRGKEYSDYERLCRGEDLFPHRMKQEHCQYKRHHPIFFIKPLKSETIASLPHVILFHDVIRGNRTSQVIQLANPKLDRAKVQDSLTGKHQATDYRIGKNAWLPDNEAVTRRVSLTTAALSNLTLDTVEYLQVLNYGIGGHYEPHYDFSTLTDVQAGGATVFPKLGVKIKPEKGACAVWYNLFKDGGGDLSTWHAACPVLVGNKWVANKWFHERGQEFTRPCSTNPDDGDQNYYDENLPFDDDAEGDGSDDDAKGDGGDNDDEATHNAYDMSSNHYGGGDDNDAYNNDAYQKNNYKIDLEYDNQLLEQR